MTSVYKNVQSYSESGLLALPYAIKVIAEAQKNCPSLATVRLTIINSNIGPHHQNLKTQLENLEDDAVSLQIIEAVVKALDPEGDQNLLEHLPNLQTPSGRPCLEEQAFRE